MEKASITQLEVDYISVELYKTRNPFTHRFHNCVYYLRRKKKPESIEERTPQKILLKNFNALPYSIYVREFLTGSSLRDPFYLSLLIFSSYAMGLF